MKKVQVVAVAAVVASAAGSVQAVEAYQTAIDSLTTTTTTAAGLILTAVVTLCGIFIAFPIVKMIYAKVKGFVSAKA